MCGSCGCNEPNVNEVKVNEQLFKNEIPVEIAASCDCGCDDECIMTDGDCDCICDCDNC